MQPIRKREPIKLKNKYRFDEETIDAILDLKWWTLMPKDMKDVQFDDIAQAIKQIKQIKDNM